MAHGIGYTVLNSFHDLVQLRSKESFQFGSLEVNVLDDIVYFTRKAEGFPSHLVAINRDSKTSAFKGIADTLTIMYDSLDTSNVGTVYNTNEAPVGFKGNEVFVFSF